MLISADGVAAADVGDHGRNGGAHTVVHLASLLSSRQIPDTCKVYVLHSLHCPQLLVVVVGFGVTTFCSKCEVIVVC